MSGLLSQIASAMSFGGPSQIGIDIGAGSVKVVAIRGDAKDPKVIGVATEQTPGGCVTDGVLGDPRSMVEVIKAALKKANVGSYQGVPANVGMRGVGVVFRRLTLPLQSPEEMASQIALEAQQQIESDLSEWIIDYQVLTSPDRQGQVAVILVGAKRNAIEDYMQTLKLIGLQPSIFDCDIFALANAFEDSNGGPVQETTLCLDIGRDTTKFNLVQDGIPVVVRSVQSGGTHLSEMIAKALGIDFERAEELKILASTSDNVQKECETAIENYIKDLLAEMKQTISFFANSNSEIKVDTIDRIVLAGGGARTRGLANAMAHSFKTQVEFLDPFRRATIVPNVAATLADQAHVYAVAYGLALRRTGDREQ